MCNTVSSTVFFFSISFSNLKCGMQNVCVVLHFKTVSALKPVGYAVIQGDVDGFQVQEMKLRHRKNKVPNRQM